MLRNLMNFPLSCYKNVTRSAILSDNVMCNRNLISPEEILSTSRFHTSALNMVANKRGLPVRRKMQMEHEAGIKGPVPQRVLDVFPDPDLPDRIFNGVAYKDLPIVNIKVSKNNTLLCVTDCFGHVKLNWSCGLEGFKNAKQGTNIAAQLTGLNFARKIVDLGYKTIRLKIRGMGPGRSSAVKGLVTGGLDIVSVTDYTHVSDKYPRPKKLRRI